MTNEMMAYPINNQPKGITEKVIPGNEAHNYDSMGKLTGVLFITSYPPRECGIATYSQDLVRSLNEKFDRSFAISICPVESDNEKHIYPGEIKYILDTDQPGAFTALANAINNDQGIEIVMIQHEFGFFNKKEIDLTEFLATIIKPVITVFHTVLPKPHEFLRDNVQQIVAASEAVIVMTNTSAKLLMNDYGVPSEKITVIPHGTHLVPHSDKEALKLKYELTGKKVLTTFGLLSPGKSIETTLYALPSIIQEDPDTIFLIIGKTHPAIVKQEGYKYHNMLDEIVTKLNLQDHVQYINYYLPLPELLDYLQLTDIYLFTSRDPNQAVSGTFSYALSCGCPIVSTPIPHAIEVLRNDAGMIIDFENPVQLADAVINLLKDETVRNNISSNGLHRMASTAWENSAIAHALLFEKITDTDNSPLHYNMPPLNLAHIHKMTTGFGMIQFSNINHPSIDSGYTLDDNARAMIALCQHYKLTNDETDVEYINIYFSFIKHCLQPEGYFLNYVDGQNHFTEQNYSTNLADSNGRAIWALGYLVSMSHLLPERYRSIGTEAESIMQTALLNVNNIHSTRAMAFVIKGLYYLNIKNRSLKDTSLIKHLANKLVQMYRHETDKEWHWFESYLTYANSILPEAMLCAWLATCEPVYKEIAKSSFDFLLSKTFRDKGIHVVSNKGWLQKGKEPEPLPVGGEQPIDVAYSILALRKFHQVFNEEGYMKKMKIAFNWFLGKNHLNQVVYNPCTGGCYDGLEENYVNLNQGAESTVSYLMARLTVEKPFRHEQKIKEQKEYYLKQRLQQEAGNV